MKTLDEMVQIFAVNAESNAYGYATAFHAGLAAVIKEIALEMSHSGDSSKDLSAKLEILAFRG